MNTQKYFTVLLTNVFLLVLIMVGLAARDALKQTAVTMKQTQQAVKEMQRDIHNTSQNLNAALIQIGLVSNQVREASYEQREYWTKAALETDKTVRALRQLIDRTDRQLNDQLLPRAASFVDHQDQSLGAVERDAEASLQASNRAAIQLANTLDALRPEIESSAKHIDATTQHIDAITADTQAYIHRLTKPASTARTVGTTILNIGVHILQFVKAVF